MPGQSGQTIASSADHHRLVTVADVIGEQSAHSRWSLGRIDEHRLLALHHADDDPLGIEDETIASCRTVPRGSAVANSKPAIRAPPRAHLQPIFPAERHRVALEVTRRRRRQRLEAIGRSSRSAAT